MTNWAYRVSISIVCLTLIVTTAATYSSVANCSFISLDDREYVYQNRHVIEGLTWSSWWYAWTSFDCANWHPLTWLSLELDGGLSGGNPAVFHLVNLGLHTLNTLLVFAALHMMTFSIYRSACVAALFALHPLHVESVAWVAERKDVLSTFFMLLTIAAYVRYVGRASRLWYVIAIVLFGFGLLAKPMLVMLPFLLLLLDVWPLKRIDLWVEPLGRANFRSKLVGKLFLEKLPYFILAFADGVTTMLAQRDATRPLAHLRIDVRIANLLNAYDWYLQKTFLPVNLTVFYPHPQRDLSIAAIATGVVVVTAISAWVIWNARTKPYLSFGWMWFVISLFPVIGVLQVGGQAYADRYTYIPHIGLFVMIVWETYSWCAAWKMGRAIHGLVIIACLVPCILLTREQLGFWKDTETIWNHTLDVDPKNALAHLHLADLMQASERHEEAVNHLAAAMTAKYVVPTANMYCYLGQSLVALNQPAEAEQQFLQALKLDGKHELTLGELAKLMRSQGRHFSESRVLSAQEKLFSESAAANPNDATTLLNLGLALARQGKITESIPHFQKAVKIAPQSAAAHNNLALALKQVGQKVEAKSHFERALELNSQLAVAHFNLAVICQEDQDIECAKTHFAEALRINPNDTEADVRLNKLLNP